MIFRIPGCIVSNNKKALQEPSRASPLLLVPVSFHEIPSTKFGVAGVSNVLNSTARMAASSSIAPMKAAVPRIYFGHAEEALPQRTNIEIEHEHESTNYENKH